MNNEPITEDQINQLYDDLGIAPPALSKEQIEAVASLGDDPPTHQATILEGAERGTYADRAVELIFADLQDEPYITVMVLNCDVAHLYPRAHEAPVQFADRVERARMLAESVYRRMCLVQR